MHLFSINNIHNNFPKQMLIDLYYFLKLKEVCASSMDLIAMIKDRVMTS